MTVNREVWVYEKVVLKFDAAPGVSGDRVEITRFEAEMLLEALADVLGRDE